MVVYLNMVFAKRSKMVKDAENKDEYDDGDVICKKNDSREIDHKDAVIWVWSTAGLSTGDQRPGSQLKIGVAGLVCPSGD